MMKFLANVQGKLVIRYQQLSLLFAVFLASVAAPRFAAAHDTWVEAGPLHVATGEYIYVDLMLGNHGNEHRDFRLASKITLAPCTLSVISPSGQTADLIPEVIDMGSAEKEGYWTARHDLGEAGIHEIVHTLDTLHGTIRAIKSAKTYVIASGREPTTEQAAMRILEPLGHGLELVLGSSPQQLGAGKEVELQVLRSGKPLTGARVSFIPRGTTLSFGFDKEHERTSDAQGKVRYVPKQGNSYLAVVHLLAGDESGVGYERTHYSAVMVLPVPNR